MCYSYVLKYEFVHYRRAHSDKTNIHKYMHISLGSLMKPGSSPEWYQRPTCNGLHRCRSLKLIAACSFVSCVKTKLQKVPPEFMPRKRNCHRVLQLLGLSGEQKMRNTNWVNNGDEKKGETMRISHGTVLVSCF